MNVEKSGNWLAAILGLFVARVLISKLGKVGAPEQGYTAHTKDYTGGNGLFGKHHGVFMWRTWGG